MSKSITTGRPGVGYHVREISPSLHLVLAYGAEGIEAFQRDPLLAAPGVYVSITRTAYLGCAESSVSARAARLAPASDALLALVGGAGRFQDGDAHALERIAFQALDAAGVPLRNRHYPEGAPVGLSRYVALQRAWAETTGPLRELAPRLACPWTGPDYLLPPPGEDEAEPLPTRWRGALGAAQASLRSVGGAYVVEAGSRLRLEPIASAPGLCQTMRDELAFTGVIVREPQCWWLTRDVYLPTLAACSRFVFTGGGSGYWRVANGPDVVAYEPDFQV